MERLLCAACDRPLTVPLRLLDPMPERPGFDGLVGPDGYRRPPATLPRGRYAVDPERRTGPFVPYEGDDDAYDGAFPDGPWRCGESGWLVAGGPRDCYVLHPDDVLPLDFHPDYRRLIGCCGPAGDGGANRVCACGAEVAIALGDCTTAYETLFPPDAVRVEPV
ncbi:hypothetical protein [Streptomyces fradiae]|uniref:hypothetical protein n=1 Tax=Streptomyces fradiae TaxID=1906 RepID=UPI00351984AD